MLRQEVKQPTIPTYEHTHHYLDAKGAFLLNPLMPKPSHSKLCEHRVDITLVKLSHKTSVLLVSVQPKITHRLILCVTLHSNPTLYPYWHFCFLDKTLQHIIRSSCLKILRWLYIAGTFKPCESILNAKRYLLCLQGLWQNLTLGCARCENGLKGQISAVTGQSIGQWQQKRHWFSDVRHKIQRGNWGGGGLKTAHSAEKAERAGGSKQLKYRAFCEIGL